MAATAPEEQRESFMSEINDFTYFYRRYLMNKNDPIQWSKIEPPPPSMLREHADLPPCADIKAALSKLVVIRFNGGLGTTMGCTSPQSSIEVRDEVTFLDMVVQEIQSLNRRFEANVPLVLMNSFYTQEKTREILGKYSQSNIRILTFNQSRHPRFWKDSLLPVPTRFDSPSSCWCPPGHGDVYMSFANSGLLQQMQAEGRQVAFIANINNAGARVDFSILAHMLGTGCEYLLELTQKTPADVKGGTLISYEGTPRLLEYSQVPEEHLTEFREKKYATFNTNNIWASLEAIDQVVFDAYLGGPHSLITVDLIVNQKKLDGKTVIQLETAAGSAIKCFSKPIGLMVPRSRFLPVKNTADLFLMHSNLFTLENESALQLNPLRQEEGLPRVKFGSKFANVDDYLARIPCIPDILELDHLTVSGDVYIGKNVVLKGTVIIVAQLGERIDIPDSSIIENKIITGNLRILEH